jgi:hypothetical protein
VVLLVVEQLVAVVVVHPRHLGPHLVAEEQLQQLALKGKHLQAEKVKHLQLAQRLQQVHNQQVVQLVRYQQVKFSKGYSLERLS